MPSLILAAVSKTPFYIAGGALAVYAVILATIGITAPNFPFGKTGQRAVILLSALVVIVTVALSVKTSTFE
jgi:hypothetical protein